MGGFRQAQAYTAAGIYVPQVAAATATVDWPIFTAPVKCRVTRVKITPLVATTGDNTNTKNLNLINKGAAFAGTTEVGNKDLVTGTDLAIGVAVEIPLNTTYVNGTDLAEGAVLALQYEKVGTGVIVGALLVDVDYVPV